MGYDYGRGNKRWRHLREQALRRDGYRCRECARYGRLRPAEVVHQVWPVEDYPEYAYSLDNLLSLCVSCHDAMHERGSRRLTPLGERWRRKVIPRPSRR